MIWKARVIGSSNRTFMELKLMFPMFCNTEDTSSNRTFMELKFGRCCGHIYALGCSNRTFMELK